MIIGNEEILGAVKAAAKAAWHAGRGRLDHDDCVSEANEAVALAMRTYDRAKGSSLSTYAAQRARWQAKKLLERVAKSIVMPTEWFDAVPARTPSTLKESFEGLERRVAVLWIEHGYTYREIADRTGMSCFRVFEIMKRVKKTLLAGRSTMNGRASTARRRARRSRQVAKHFRESEN